MNSLLYSSNIFLRDIIRRAAWMYLRFALSFHDVKEVLAERGIMHLRQQYSSSTLTYHSFGKPVHQGCRSP